MAFPDGALGDDEALVRHLHPHAVAVVRPVVALLVLVGAASFGAAAVPAGPDRTTARWAVLGAALLLAAVLVVRPLAAWAGTHYVLTTHRLMVRRGVLVRSGRDLPLSRVTEVSYRQTLPQRVLRSGTVVVGSVGDTGPAVLERVPGCESVVALLHELLGTEQGAWEQPPGATGGSGWADEGWADEGWADETARGDPELRRAGRTTDALGRGTGSGYPAAGFAPPG